MLRTFLCVCLLACAFVLGDNSHADDDFKLRTFKKIVLTTDFLAEGSGIGDFNRDGKMDVVYGPQWYEGPDFKNAHTIYPIQKFDPRKYSNNFITMTHDVNGDGYVDVLVNEWPGKAVHWFENPQGKDTPWKKHLAHAAVDNESPQLGDITGDGKPELLFHTG
ncbi:MAG: VCBS repeat-containing protein, partial [Pirellulales bacterium]|nr:VCBS repeat-containing protein [Pirellulales bacterium]